MPCKMLHIEFFDSSVPTAIFGLGGPVEPNYMPGDQFYTLTDGELIFTMRTVCFDQFIGMLTAMICADADADGGLLPTGASEITINNPNHLLNPNYERWDHNPQFREVVNFASRLFKYRGVGLGTRGGVSSASRAGKKTSNISKTRSETLLANLHPQRSAKAVGYSEARRHNFIADFNQDPGMAGPLTATSRSSSTRSQSHQEEQMFVEGRRRSVRNMPIGGAAAVRAGNVDLTESPPASPTTTGTGTGTGTATGRRRTRVTTTHDAIGSRADDNDVIIRFPMEENAQDVITITKGNCRRLVDGEYLNDSLIDFCIKRMLIDPFHDCFDELKRRNVHAFSSLFYNKLISRDGLTAKDIRAQGGINYRAVARWARHINLFEKEFLYIPVNKGIHWSLFIVVRPNLLVPKFHERSEGTVVSTSIETATATAAESKVSAPIADASSEATESRVAAPIADASSEATSAPAPAPAPAPAETGSNSGTKPTKRVIETVFMYDAVLSDQFPCIVHLDSLALHGTAPIARHIKQYLKEEFKAKFALCLSPVTSGGSPDADADADAGAGADADAGATGGATGGGGGGFVPVASLQTKVERAVDGMKVITMKNVSMRLICRACICTFVVIVWLMDGL